MRNKQPCASIWHKVNLFLSHHSINKTIMDLYAEDLADYIYQENNVDKKRALLLEVEAEIKKLMGEQEKGSLDLRHIGAVQIEKIQDLIGTRSLILNRMFQATSQEIQRFESVNELLDSLTKKMYHRMANLYRTLIDSPKDESFDDDYVVSGTLKYVYNDEDSILILPEDGHYGSDFAYMIELIYYLLEDYNGGVPEIEECSCNYSPKNTSDMTDEQLQCVDIWDDGVTWAEGHLRRPELENVVVCHAVHDICTHKPYSIPDLLRLNDFWVEAHLICQHIIDQNGKRYNSD